MKTWKHVTLLVLAGLLVGAGAHAYDRAPLFWQTAVGRGDISVQRLHDAEAQIYCYVAYNAEDADLGDVAGHSSPSISCVKAR